MKKLLIVVDYQNDFVYGSLGFEKAVEIGAAIREKINIYKSCGDDVAFTMDTHLNDYPETEEGKNLPVLHCLKGSEGHQLCSEIKELSKDALIFEKDTFGSARLFEFLCENPYEYIELCGVVSNICVISNAVVAKTACPNAVITVDRNACAAPDEEMHEAALKVMKGLHIKIN